eukprot:TRINITY_DN21563_c0_g1_i1.p1 TRINITY_DN21563_c0_g1~~TRINITY_DN21563_c0_g1_i1.p1  ORF type:complete len:190 (+),score=51.00 TRINITY_DN21563_c0_g1_i1:107-676(+)
MALAWQLARSTRGGLAFRGAPLLPRAELLWACESRHFVSGGSSSSSSSQPSPEKPETVAEAKPKPFQGKYSIEGVLLPIEDLEAPEESSISSIESRLQDRLRQKSTSSKLMEKEDKGGMFRAVPADAKEAPAWKEFQVKGEIDHLDEFQNVMRRLRRTGRDHDERDLSDSMLKAMEYTKKNKKKGGGGL